MKDTVKTLLLSAAALIITGIGTVISSKASDMKMQKMVDEAVEKALSAKEG